MNVTVIAQLARHPAGNVGEGSPESVLLKIMETALQVWFHFVLVLWAQDKGLMEEVLVDLAKDLVGQEDSLDKVLVDLEALAKDLDLVMVMGLGVKDLVAKDLVDQAEKVQKAQGVKDLVVQEDLLAKDLVEKEDNLVKALVDLEALLATDLVGQEGLGVKDPVAKDLVDPNLKEDKWSQAKDLIWEMVLVLK